MSSRVLLTGAQGLVGRAVARRLERAGRFFVPIDHTGGEVAGREVIECDVTDPHRLHELAATHSFDAIVHCAAFSGPMMGADRPGAVIATNVGGTANLLEVARIHSIPRFVFCSSVSAVGPTTEAIGENVPLRPTTVYGSTKAACEALIGAYHQEFEMTTVCLRFSAVWGPERKTVCALGTMISDAVRGQKTVFEHGADFPTQYVHADDAAGAILRAMDTPEPAQRVYNITGDEFMPLRDVAEMVRASLPGASITIGPGGEPMYDWQEQFSIEAARQDLSYAPSVPLSQGIKDFADAISMRNGVENDHGPVIDRGRKVD